MSAGFPSPPPTPPRPGPPSLWQRLSSHQHFPVWLTMFAALPAAVITAAATLATGGNRATPPPNTAAGAQPGSSTEGRPPAASAPAPGAGSSSGTSTPPGAPPADDPATTSPYQPASPQRPLKLPASDGTSFHYTLAELDKPFVKPFAQLNAPSLDGAEVNYTASTETVVDGPHMIGAADNTPVGLADRRPATPENCEAVATSGADRT
ncbi:hypothetical protein ACIO3O_17770 [Streptomyces sp. NPDC087440]|uniref:hypothetical protein n=1 Tax=Streptomyces sp. NPDC087440 TaxID=3365790 RepID=UPI00380E4FC9